MEPSKIPVEGADSSTVRIAPSTPFFSLHSHRLIVCFLLLLAIYFGYANGIGMSTAVVCMVNSSLVVDRFEGSSHHQTCPVKEDETSLAHEFAIPGTMEWSASQQSLLLSARFYGGCVTVAFSGFVADRLGPNLVLTVVLLLSSALTLATPLLAYANYHLLLVTRFMIGAIESFLQPAVNCIAASWFPQGEKTVAVSIYSMGVQFSGGFSSLFAASLCSSSMLGGWPSIFYVFGGTCCVFTALWIIFGAGGPAKNRWVTENERKWLADKITLKRKGAIPFSRILRSTAVHSVCISNFAFHFATSIMQSFLPLFLRELGLPIQTIGWYTLAPFISIIAGKGTIGTAIDYCAGKEWISLSSSTKLSNSIGSIGSSLALILLSTLPSCTNSTIALYILVVYGVLYSGCTCGVNTSMFYISPANIGTLSSLAALSRVVGAVTSTSIVNALTATEAVYKWQLVFASAALFQCIGGIHFHIFGTTEEQSW